MALKDKVALVTGGTGALGSAIVRRLANEGIHVFVSYVTEQKISGISSELKDRVTLVKANVTDEVQVRNLFDTIIQKRGKIEIVVNTVGGFVGGKSVSETSIDEWEMMMNTNLGSAFLCTREALRWMKGKKYGRIINTSAMVAIHPTPGKAAYAVSKAGVILLTEVAAKEEKGTGITINAIAPSIISTPANLRSMPDEDSTKWVQPEEIADMVCYLCSDAARSITGTTLRAFGGV